MNFKFTFKHMKTSDALRAYAQEKIADKVEKFVTKPIEVRVTFGVEHMKNQIHLSLYAGDGFDVQAEQEADDMYAAVDLLVDKLEIQLRKHKEKLKDHKHDGGLSSVASSLTAPILNDDTMDAVDVLALEAARQQKGAATL